MQTTHLVIADFKITLQSDAQIDLEEGYLPFISKNAVQQSDVNILCREGLPDILPTKDKQLFEARNKERKFYSIYRSGTKLLFEIYDQKSINEIQQIAILESDLSTWNVFTIPSTDNKHYPLKYPFGPIMMYYLTVISEAVMIHASGVFDGNKGRIFTGFSGKGKSTMAKIWESEGYKLINDDRLIIRKDGDKYYIHNTPMFYRDEPKIAPLHSIHLISHSPENKTQRVVGAKAVSKVLAYCIQNNYDKRFIVNHLNFVSGLCGQVEVYDTGFVPDKGIVEFLREKEQEETPKSPEGDFWTA